MHILYEELLTIITRGKTCLNSRHLTPISFDPSNMTSLTSGHFQIGSPFTARPEVDKTKLSLNILNRWHRVAKYWYKL